MKRFIGSSFDVYFHLWNNDVPHWEREKRLWEEELGKEWVKILSKKDKRQLNSPSRKPPKKVRFAKKLVQDSPPVKHRPSFQQSFKVGDVIVPIVHSGRPSNLDVSDVPI